MNLWLLFSLILVIGIQCDDEIDELKDMVWTLQDQIDQLWSDFSSVKTELEQLKSDFELGQTCGEGWVSYAGRKCLKVLDKKGSESEAKASCSDLESSATLITILTAEEQQYVNDLLKDYKGTSDHVWIGLEYVNGGFKWLDGSALQYENWGENAVKDGSSKCVQMSLTDLQMGKWVDDVCERKYLIACQKPSHKDNVNQEIQELRNIVIRNEGEIDSLKASEIPIGFIYTQLPNQTSPEELFPQLTWEDVTHHFAGLFFRAEGDGSAAFGKVQEANQSWISTIRSQSCSLTNTPSTCGETHNYDLTHSGWSNNIIDNWFNDYLYFYTTEAEVRPKNSAVRLWKRTK